MEETKMTEAVVSKEKKNGRKALFISLGVLGLVLVAGIVVVFLYAERNNRIASIDAAVTSIGDLLTNTEGINNEVADLPDNFLDAETVSTSDVDKAVSDIDSQLKSLDGLNADFDLQLSDVGL